MLGARRAIMLACASALALSASASTAIASAGSAATFLSQNAPRITLQVPHPRGASSIGWASTNWSGYAVSSSAQGTYQSITGQWVVPTVRPSSKRTYSSAWIGIDGFLNSSLIQVGTEQDASSNGTRYGAWWEILPAAETVIPNMTISPGDRMSASIQDLGGGTWMISITDLTSGNSFSTDQPYSGPQTSAEWILEAPSLGGAVTTLANYGTATFDPGTVNGISPNLVAQDGGVMIQHKVQVSTPSIPDVDSDGFSVRYGSTAPPPPQS